MQKRMQNNVAKLNHNILNKYPFLKSSSNGKRLSIAEQAIAYYNLENLKSQRIIQIITLLVVIANLILSIFYMIL
jgi:hypothetical protein